MRVHLGNFGKVIFVLLALTLSQCGKKSKSQQVKISVTAPSPIVFTSSFDTTRGGQPVHIKGPWFQMTVQIDNQSDTPVTLLALHVDVQGQGADGQTQTVSQDFVPSQDNFTVSSNGTNLICNYTDYGQFDKAGTVTSSGSLSESNVPTGCTTGTVTFFVSELPAPPTGTSLIRYTVTVKPQGYFGVRNVPTDRFDNSTTIYTQ